MFKIDTTDVIAVVVAVIVSVAMLGVLVPILNTMTAEGGALQSYSDLVNIIPMILVIVIMLMPIGLILKKNSSY